MINGISETFKVAIDKTAADLIPDIKPSPYTTLTYLPKTNELLFHTAHWRTDGIGALLLMDEFFDLVVSSNISDPRDLFWGQEVARLAPTVEDAAKMPDTPIQAIRDLVQKCIDTTSAAAGAIGILYNGTPGTPPAGTHSSSLRLSLSETTRVVQSCKQKGFSVTSAIHASVAAANYAFAADKHKDKHYTSTIRFSLRPYLPEPYSSPSYASGLYTTGWMKAVSAFARWEERARAYNEEYRRSLTKLILNRIGNTHYA